MCVVVVVVEEGEGRGDKPNHVTTDSLRSVLLDCWNWTALSGTANDWRNRGHVALDLFSNRTWVRSIGFFGGPLGPSDDPTWANFGKQNWRWHRPAFRVSIQNVTVYAGTTRICWNTCARVAGKHGRFECTHGGVFESAHGFFHIFQRAATHTNTHKHTNTHTRNTHHDHQQHHDHNTQHNTETETDRDRERRQEKTRQRKIDKTRQEKMKERREQMKEEEREKKWKRKWRDRDERKMICQEIFQDPQPARWISPKCFEKIPFGRIIPPFFLRKFRIWQCLQLFTWFEFDFSGLVNQFRMGFSLHGKRENIQWKDNQRQVRSTSHSGPNTEADWRKDKNPRRAAAPCESRKSPKGQNENRRLQHDGRRNNRIDYSGIRWC